MLTSTLHQQGSGSTMPPAAYPFDRMIPVTMSHYPITYSGVINNPDPGVLRSYVDRLGPNGLPARGTASIYLHVPFCDQICTFCRYARTKTPEDSVFLNYAAALKEEMSRYLSENQVTKQYHPERLELMDDLPKTPSGKLQKFKLRESAKVFGDCLLYTSPSPRDS